MHESDDILPNRGRSFDLTNERADAERPDRARPSHLDEPDVLETRDAGLDADHQVEQFLLGWRDSVERPVRVDAQLAALLEHGTSREEPTVETGSVAIAEVVSLDEARRRRGGVRRAVVRGGVVGIAAMTVSSGLAAAGVLPAPVQRAVSGAAHVVGIDISEPERPVLRTDTTAASTAAQSVFDVPSTRSPEGGTDVITTPRREGRTGNTGTSSGTPTTEAKKPRRPAPTTTHAAPTTAAPTTTVPPDSGTQCQAGESNGDQGDGAAAGDGESKPCRPPCRTVDPKTGEPIPPWKQRQRCRPCPARDHAAPNAATHADSESENDSDSDTGSDSNDGGGRRNGRCRRRSDREGAPPPPTTTTTAPTTTTPSTTTTPKR